MSRAGSESMTKWILLNPLCTVISNARKIPSSSATKIEGPRTTSRDLFRGELMARKQALAHQGMSLSHWKLPSTATKTRPELSYTTNRMGGIIRV